MDERNEHAYDFSHNQKGTEMNITQITVSIHEKRNHPHEYGHYDAEVRYTADLLPDEDVLKRTKELQFLADSFVSEKCAAWIKNIELDRRIETTRQTFSRRLNHAVYTDDETEMEKRLADLVTWVQEEAGKVNISLVGELWEQIEQARQKWHEFYAKRDTVEQSEV